MWNMYFLMMNFQYGFSTMGKPLPRVIPEPHLDWGAREGFGGRGREGLAQ